MIRCRKCGINYSDKATKCLKCLNPLCKSKIKLDNFDKNIDRELVPDTSYKLEISYKMKLQPEDYILYDGGYLDPDGAITHLNLTAQNLSNLPDKIGELKQLRTLDLERNKFEIFPDNLDKLENLEELFISENNLTSLSSSIGSLTKLKYLWLYDNKISSLPDELSLLQDLELLDLRGNNLTSKILTPIFKLKNLKFLSLIKNNITTLSNEINNLTNLEKLLIANNPLESLPDLSGLINLKELNLYCTKLIDLPENIIALPQLKIIDVHNTNITPENNIIMELKSNGIIVQI